ncbi:MAG: NAD-dependent epimerase/dehydratase family protein [Candidatus Poribacteria bacterium]|nr:NAD-dependent epimerase/dehydratase family protein [Candidatus Poribacteria bacterium]
MRVLIIGGTGLISTAITRFLIERGDDVTLYNRGQTEAEVPEGYQLISGDRKDYAAFEAQMAEAGPFDTVIDMIGFVPEEVESDVRAFRGRIGQFIFCSTIDVYTKPARRYPICEDEERQPTASFPYAFDKAKCERILEQAHARGNFPVTIIRPAHTYGEGRGLIHSLRGGMYYLDRIRRGNPIITHGDGSSLWASCHRDDVAQAFVEAIGNERTFGKSYHTAGEEPMTWNQYHQAVARAMDAPEPNLVHIPTDLLFKVAPKEAEWCKENFQYNNIFGNTAARADLNFRYRISLLEGVGRIVAWLDERDRIHDKDEPAVYDAIIKAWERLGRKMTEALAVH